jgi:ADP-heptose:LPS heptosyltransferase
VSTLVIHPGPLGDLLLAVPALRALRAAALAAPLVLAAQPRLGALLTSLGVVDRHLDFEGLGLERLFADDGPPTPPGALQGVSRIICWFGARDAAFTRRLRDIAPGAVVASPTGDGMRSVWQHLLTTVGASAGSWCAPLAVPAELAAAGRGRLERAGWDGRTALLIVHAGAGGAGKRWSAEGFADVLRTLRPAHRLAILLHEGPADLDAVAVLGSLLAGQARLLRGLTLPELTGALAHATAFLGNDSGPSHLAAALGARSLILYTTATRAWWPWSPAAQPVHVSSADPAEVAAIRDRLSALLG